MAKRVLLSIGMPSALTSPAFAGVKIVATLPWIGSIAREIGRDRVDVTILVKPNEDPHHVEARPGMILAASRADLLLYNGLDLEAGYLPLITGSSRNAGIQPGQPGNLDCSRYVEPIERIGSDVDRSMSDVHPMGNPHDHYSARNVRRVAEGIERALSQADPANAGHYAANLAAFREKVGTKQRQWAAVPLKGKRFVAYHKHFEYLAADYGFEIVGYVEPKPGIPPSARHLERLTETMRRTRPDGVLMTPGYGRKEVGLLSRETGARVVVIPPDVGAMPGTEDWFSFMDKTILSLR